jgi:phosphopantothenoylcysteine decarboxylase/phosphopantothenate--cysteine ligase
MFIALGIGGGIAAYKACEVVRGLDRAGVEVQVILTRNATQFVTPLTLQTLSRRRVLLDPFELSSVETIQHIELTRRIDALVVAPATANLLAKFARGIADDLLSTFYTAVTRPVVVAPAMNTRMWLHQATQDNLALLRARGVATVGPEEGWLAEGESGWGRRGRSSRPRCARRVARASFRARSSW